MIAALRPLEHSDVDAHCAGEDEQTIRWHTGGRGTVETTKAHFDWLAENARVGTGKRGFGVWVDDRLAGYVDANPDDDDGLLPSDVNISYSVHPWARGNGVAGEAVALICEFIRGQALGQRAAIKVEPENTASVRVAQKAGFSYSNDFVSGTDTHPDGTAVTFSLYVLAL
ncbi:MAG: GNAT family N-acetyltransferase [Actinomycetota bacterium]|nr:GNAT family N-acetyltransferase [Actinomycetota bacterium]